MTWSPATWTRGPAADELLNPVLSFDNGRIADDPPDGSGSRERNRYAHLADDSLRVAQIAPPDIDDLPAELTQHPLAASVPVLGRRCGVPLPALTFDSDLAPRIGEVELGQEDAVASAYWDTRRRDGCRPWPGSGRRCAGTSCGAADCRSARRAASTARAVRSGLVAATPGQRSAARRSARPDAARCPAPARSARCRRPGRAEPGCWRSTSSGSCVPIPGDRGSAHACNAPRCRGRDVGWRPGSR